MSDEQFIESVYSEISGGFGVALTVGLAVLADEGITAMSAGTIKPPAAVLIAEIVTAAGTRNPQILLSSGCLAALAGSLDAWSRRLPVAARDQYDALLAESSARWTTQIELHQAGDR